jgi:predicted phosphoribosyltransferase
MGFAFKNEQVARVVLAQALAQGSTVEDEVGEAMAKGGIYVVSVADEVREFTEGTTG